MIKLPTIKGYCAYYLDEKGKMKIIPNSQCKNKKKAQEIADEYMLINLVQTGITECLY